MHQIIIETTNRKDAEEVARMLNEIDNVDVIVGRNFSGEISTIEIYLPLITSVLVAVTPIITSLINKHKMSSIKIDGDKIELTNVSSELAEDVLKQYLEDHQKKDEKQD